MNHVVRLTRRAFVRSAGAMGAAGVASALGALPAMNIFHVVLAASGTPPSENILKRLNGAKPSAYSQNEPVNSLKAISQYNNYYEFSTDKEAVYKLADKLPLSPWQVRVEGECEKPRVFSVDDLIGLGDMEERIFSIRCVEGFSKIVPWNGFALRHLLDAVKPKPTAQFVEFQTFYDPKIMSSGLFSGIGFPYIEGLRMDEAMHPLATLCFGIGKAPLMPANGGPVRVVVPWKYGFKSAKSLSVIRLTREQPKTAWSVAQSNEYGFYANVNPEVSHPRWSQRQERRLEKFGRIETKKFNGFAEVAELYRGMDLAKYY